MSAIAPELTSRLADLAEWTGSPADAAHLAIDIYHRAAAHIDELKSVQTAAKAIICDLIAETGHERWSTPAGTAVLSSPSVRVSYSAKPLDVLCAANPDLAELIRPYRSETMVPGTVVVKGAAR